MGDCSYYGAVMNAKDGKTLGADLIEKHEALDKTQQLLKDFPSMTKSQKQKAMNEYIQLQTMIGLI
jgi:sialic acid synthase SpsE